MNSLLLNDPVSWWQNIPQRISPVFMEIGPLTIHYYGLLFCTAILTAYFLALYRLKSESFSNSYSKATVENFFMWVIIGVIGGGRLGYVLFYNFSYYLKNPLEIFLPFSFSGGFHITGISGMSYHGGLIGAVLAGVLFCRKYDINFWNFSDFFLPGIPLGYSFGRLGNFINGELYGKPTSVSWGMYFPADPANRLRHPSQLYEAFLEGVLLFIILWSLRKNKKLKGSLLAVYIIGYGAARFVAEFFREPDAHIGYIFTYFSLGQLFSLAMIAAGIFLLRWRLKKV
jgi:phosphatidylglycerol---prolipoprotein diacylglyceryl transferase